MSSITQSLPHGTTMKSTKEKSGRISGFFLAGFVLFSIWQLIAAVGVGCLALASHVQVPKLRK